MNKLLFLSLILFGCSSNSTEGYNEGSESTETNTVVSTSSRGYI